MFDRPTNYPSAVASYDDEGIDAAIAWCTSIAANGDVISVWTPLVSALPNCAKLESLVNRSARVEHITGPGSTSPSGPGPILMAWPDMDDIGEVLRFAPRVRGLCVITWNPDQIRPWVTAVRPEILGDGSEWEKLTAPLDPIIIEALKSLTLRINHNNTIKAGYEKDDVVSVLLALHDAGIRMDAGAMEGWALAHGWSGDNPAQLAKYVDDINAGKRPRVRRKALRDDYIEILREKVTQQDSAED